MFCNVFNSMHIFVSDENFIIEKGAIEKIGSVKKWPTVIGTLRDINGLLSKKNRSDLSVFQHRDK